MTVIVDAPAFIRNFGQIVDLVRIRVQLPHGVRKHVDVEDSGVARNIDVVVEDVRQPYKIVRELRSDSAPTLRMPPMLHVAFDELPARRANDVFARDAGVRIHERHRILQLIAETESAPGLTES